ncbi:hypothetical protein LTR85_007346 [Meristemomyces frigidus]|nr:hypothetical protein LTR85_007346 [Meristemomyces frigidus]
MQPGPLLDGIANNAQYDEEREEEGAFTASWQSTDTAHLQPANLPIARVQRAWERKPLSPLSRRKVRVGKVWKRSALTLGAPRDSAADDAEGEQRGLKRAKARNSMLLQSPLLKPVKKLCMDSDYGVGPRVSQWEGRGSPVRKIVTRSAVAENLIALPDERLEEQVHVEEDDNATIEILDEEGNLMEGAREDEEALGGWSDVDEEQDDDADAPFDDTIMHLGDAIEHEGQSQDLATAEAMSPLKQDEQTISIPTGQSDDQTTTGPQPITEVVTQSEKQALPTEQTATLSEEAPAAPIRAALSVAPKQQVVLPEGFVSPVKQRRKLGPRSSRVVAAARRQTLPVQFAPAVCETQAPEEKGLEANEAAVAVGPAAQEVTIEQLNEMLQPGESDSLVDAADEMNEDAEWDDVEEGVEPAGIVTEQSPLMTVAEPVGDGAEGEAAEETMDVDVPPGQASEGMLSESVEDPEAPDFGGANVFGHDLAERLPSSPVPRIDSPHPRLPLRRSPRRKSSSPLKQSRNAPASEQRPHFVAFTPLKRPESSSIFRTADTVVNDRSDDQVAEPHDGGLASARPLSRASSAPPEEPNCQVSPRKAAKPRVSDDTALLQAFLNRAAESKFSKHVSATSKQESFENRRDSDVVKAALASPLVGSQPKPDVLMDLDPNSPSPRKPSSSAALADETVSMTDQVSLASTTAAVAADEEDEQIQYETETDPAPKARRSGRGRKKPQVLSQSVYSAPSRITIRGPANANVVDAKRTEAQELVTTTRNNTKKNKAGSVLPNLRLMKMAAEKPAGGDAGEDVAMADVPAGVADGGLDGPVVMAMVEGRRGIRWAETLVEFYQGGANELETSELSDEPEERMPWERPAIADDEEEKKEAEVLAAPPAPADTPSKPKLRRLKPPRTAAMPGKTPHASEPPRTDTKVDQATAAPAPPEAQQAAKPVPKPRRSRIATPAKGLTNASLLPAEVISSAPAPAVPMSTLPEKKAAAPKKKLGSKLPAPATSLVTGKENLGLSASPPKKKPAAAASTLPTAKTFALKLDFGGSKTKFEPASTATAVSGSVETEITAPGLASPAKKAGARKAVLFGGVAIPAMSSLDERNGGGGADELPAGLRSPAKKRTRRAAGV